MEHIPVATKSASYQLFVLLEPASSRLMVTWLLASCTDCIGNWGPAVNTTGYAMHTNMPQPIPTSKSSSVLMVVNPKLSSESASSSLAPVAP